MRFVMLVAAAAVCAGGCAAGKPDVLDFASFERELSRKPMGDPGPCDVHETPHRKDTVRVVYGLLVAPPRYAEARRRLFPNARTFWPGGCVSTPDSRPTQTVYFCRECRQALAAWEWRQAVARSDGSP